VRNSDAAVFAALRFSDLCLRGAVVRPVPRLPDRGASTNGEPGIARSTQIARQCFLVE
jgi:hypothetical protein